MIDRRSRSDVTSAAYAGGGAASPRAGAVAAGAAPPSGDADPDEHAAARAHRASHRTRESLAYAQAAVTTPSMMGRSSSRVIGFSKREFGTLARNARDDGVNAPPVENTIFFSSPGQRCLIRS